jgi:hypothetical protein
MAYSKEVVEIIQSYERAENHIPVDVILCLQDLAYGCLKISFGEAVVEESLLLVPPKIKWEKPPLAVIGGILLFSAAMDSMIFL